MDVKIVEKLIYIDAAGERFVQVGTDHLRDPRTGELLGKPEPLYIKICEPDERTPTGDQLLSNAEKALLDEAASNCAAKHREYVHGIKRIDAINRVKAPEKCQ